MAKLDALIETLSREDAPDVRRAALREADLQGSEIGELIHAAIRRRSQKPWEAERLARAALIAARAGSDSWRTYRARKILAQTYLVRGDPQRALRLLSQPLPELDPKEDASLALDISQTLSLLGRREDALRVIRDARTRQPDAGWKHQRGVLYAAEGQNHGSAGMPELALSCYEQARALLAESGKPVQLLSIEQNRAKTLRDLGRLDEAEAIYRAIIPALKRHRGDAVARVARVNLALIGVSRGRFHHALRDLRGLREEFEAIGDRAMAAECNLHESEVNASLHLPTQAMDHATRAAAALQGLGMPDAQAQATYMAGVAAQGLGRNEQAAQGFDEAFSVFERSGGDRGFAAVCLLRLAETDLHIEEYGRAAQRAEEAVRRLRELGRHERASRGEAFLARLERKGGEPHRARQRLRVLLDGPHAPQTPWVRCDVHHQLGRVEETLGRLRPALRHILTACRILERYRTGVPPDEYMAAFLTSRADLFEDAVRIVLGSGSRRAPARALELAEQARARSLLDLVRAGEPTGADPAASPLAREAAALEREIDVHLASPARNGGAGSAERARKRTEFLSGREARLRACLDQLAREAPGEARRMRGAPLGYAEILRGLPQNQLLLEYYVTKRELHVFILDRNGLEHVRKPISRKALNRLIGRMRFQVDRPSVEQVYPDEARGALLHSANLVLDELDRILLTPVRDRIDGVDRVIVVPNGGLHGVPFPALQRNGVPLIEEVEVVMAPSAAVYLHCLKAETANGPPLLMGYADDFAPEIDREIRALAEILDDAEVYLGPRATIEVLREKGPAARLIHLAAHTVYRHDDSMESRLQLADGWLTVPEIYRMRIAPELLVLSGCATGRVTVTPGGDLFGLVRGFLHAGASSILSSLWEVSDGRTREYMERFYRAFHDGESAAAAMRRATLEMRAAHPHPYHWAPFLLTGRGG